MRPFVVRLRHHATVPLALLAFACLGASASLQGTFALQNAVPRTAGHLIVQAQSRTSLARNLNFWMTPLGSALPVRRYDVDMTKFLHLVIVSDDFRTFVHAHPRYTPQGHFVLDQRFPRPALYHIYADGEPRGIGQQVFRFDVPIGRVAGRTMRDVSERRRSAVAGPYVVTLDRMRLSTRAETLLQVHIRKGGKPARDLHPYLGALGHAVFLNVADLTYVHVHPMPLTAGDAPAEPNRREAMLPNTGMEMSGMRTAPLSPASTIAPDMLLHVAVRERGTYKLWFQFRGAGALRVAAFVLTAS